MDKSGLFGELLEQGKSSAQDMGKSITDQVGQSVKSAVGQVAPGLGSSEPSQEGIASNKQDPNAQKQTREFVKDMYGIEDIDQVPDQQQVEQQKQAKQAQDKQKLETLRMELHKKTYYDPLIEAIDRPQDQQEERASEKNEREDQEKKQEEAKEQEEETKKAPIAVHRAQRIAEMGRLAG
ncbi:hypothetical protein M1349_04865 [Patescibacteria group bacterium]|nr:hypothetical protein [Patescibacteria group bacterium]